MRTVLRVNWDLLTPASMTGDYDFLSIEEAQNHAEAAWNIASGIPLVWENQNGWLTATTSDGNIELLIREFPED